MIVLFFGVSILLVDAYLNYSHPSAPQTNQVQIAPTSPTSISLPSATPTQGATLTFLRRVDAAQIAAAQQSFIGKTLPVSISEIAVYQLKYDILGHDGNWKPIVANVYIPVNPGSYPLFVFGAGTTGMADKCAPTLENVDVENVGNYDHHMITQAAAGYVAVLPDYEGFHNNDPLDATQAYFISESEAKTLVGAVSSLTELQPSTPPLQFADPHSVFLAGYSQGGHAALSAAATWQSLPSSIQLKGVIQYAGAADVQALFRESPWLASYLVGSYIQYYGAQLDPALVLQHRWLQPLSRNNEVLCVNDAYRYFPHSRTEMYTPAFLDAIETGTWPANLEQWHTAIEANTSMTNLPNVPYLSIEGAVDPIVTPQTQVSNIEVLCQQNKHVTYREYAGVNHFQIRQASFEFSNDWMKNILSGQTYSNTCAQ